MFIISDLVIEHKKIRIKRKTSVNCACSFAFVNVFILFFFFMGATNCFVYMDLEYYCTFDASDHLTYLIKCWSMVIIRQ